MNEFKTYHPIVNFVYFVFVIGFSCFFMHPACLGISLVFEYLTHKNISKDTIKIAYFPYILQKYNILKHDEEGKLTDVLLELLRSVNIYCRENTLKSIYSINKYLSMI